MPRSISCLRPGNRQEMFPAGYATWVEMDGAAVGLEGDYRPGHFRAVASVCLKLFAIVRPQLAFFGQKDAQQVAVVKQLVRDFNIELDIRVVPTLRDADGLAMSSRNARLTPEERRRSRHPARAVRGTGGPPCRRRSGPRSQGHPGRHRGRLRRGCRFRRPPDSRDRGPCRDHAAHRQRAPRSTGAEP